MSVFEYPDFVGGEHYIEKFKVNAYKRLTTVVQKINLAWNWKDIAKN